MKYLKILTSLFLFIIFSIGDAAAVTKKKHRGSKIASKVTSAKFHSKSRKSAKRSAPLKASKAKYAAIVMDADTGSVLHAEDADAPRFPASCTKMMTLYIVFEALKEGDLTLNTPMKISRNAALQPATKLYLREGETITLQNAILGLVTKSANDASVVIAEHLAGSVENFARIMTRKARGLGMKHTTFKNPHGLPNPEQITTARDLAILSRALYHHYPKQYKYFATESFTHKGVVHRNHNHLLGKVEGVDGIKTGLTNASGFNLAASAVRYDANNTPRRLITVVMGGPNRHWRDKRVEQLFETYFPHMGINGKGADSEPLQKEVSLQNTGHQTSDPLTNLIYESAEEDDDQTVTLNRRLSDEDEEEGMGGNVLNVSQTNETQSEEDFSNDNDSENLTTSKATHTPTPANWVVPKPSSSEKATKRTRKRISGLSTGHPLSTASSTKRHKTKLTPVKHTRAASVVKAKKVGKKRRNSLKKKNHSQA